MSKIGNIVRILVILSLVYWVLFLTAYPLPLITSTFLEFILKLIGIPTISYGQYLIVNFGSISRTFHLSTECAGIALFSVFLMGAFIVPGFKLKHRLLSILFVPLLFLGNSLRILLSILVARYYSVDLSIFFHDTLGQVIIFAIAIFAYLL